MDGGGRTSARARLTRLARLALAISAGVPGLLACVPTLPHPMRVTPGLFVEGGAVGNVPEGQQVYCYTDCVDISAAEGSVPIAMPYISIGWGALPLPQLGLMGGISGPARSDLDSRGIPLPLGARLFGLVTTQSSWGSLGLGMDIGVAGAAWTFLGEVRPGEHEYWVPALGGFHRWYVPYVWSDGSQTTLTSGATVRLDSISPTWDVGARVTAGFLFVQWTLTGETSGLRGYPYFEGGQLSSMRHTIQVGIVIQAICDGPECTSHAPRPTPPDDYVGGW